MDHLPLLIGALIFVGIALIIVRKVTALMFKMTIVGILLVLSITAYMFRDKLPL